MLKVTLKTAEDSFYGLQMRAEVARILRKLADDIDNSELTWGKLRDEFNTEVGTWYLERDFK